MTKPTNLSKRFRFILVNADVLRVNVYHTVFLLKKSLQALEWQGLAQRHVGVKLRFAF